MMKTTKFGVNQVFKRSPKWLVPVFSIIMIIVQVLDFTVSGDTTLSDAFKLQFNHYLNAVALAVSLIALLFGEDIKSKE